MTAGEVLAAVDGLRPNQYDAERKLRWLRRLDGQLLLELEGAPDDGGPLSALRASAASRLFCLRSPSVSSADSFPLGEAYAPGGFCPGRSPRRGRAVFPSSVIRLAGDAGCQLPPRGKPGVWRKSPGGKPMEGGACFTGAGVLYCPQQKTARQAT